jgi:hypothetical protein
MYRYKRGLALLFRAYLHEKRQTKIKKKAKTTKKKTADSCRLVIN